MDINEMHVAVGEVEYINGEPVTNEAVIYFSALFDSPEIRVNAPQARVLAERIAKLWNDAAITSVQST